MSQQETREPAASMLERETDWSLAAVLAVAEAVPKHRTPK
jgi:hypothetical protein